MKSHLREMYAHQEWADAEHWRALEAHPPALADPAVRNRLFHIHLVQKAFLWTVGPRTSTFELKKPEGFPATEDMKGYARAYHADMAAMLEGLTDARLAEQVEIPWFKEPPLKISVEHALMQAAMHSHYHRGQNATRLRELGGVPPTTDFIVWLWRGQPPPRWS